MTVLFGALAGIRTLGLGHRGRCLFVIERPGGLAAGMATCCAISTYRWQGENEGKSFDIQRTWGEILLATDGLSEDIDIFTGERVVIAV